ncbi:MAG: hypothetical protein IH842_03905 [Thaumarchaeota archaeon]|nr:hypothetical protein [Nitrososphaerota archaeon]
MSLKIKRPKGVTVALVLLSLDAGVMVIFLVVLIGMPEYASLFETPAFGQEYAILNSTELMFEVTILATIVDVIVIIGLLCAKPSGRKLAIGGAVAGIVSYAIFFAIPGIVAFSILLWYMFRTHTKEYFENKEKMSKL